MAHSQQSLDAGQQRRRPLWLAVAAAACCVAVAAAWMALELLDASWAASTRCHPQLADTVVGALAAGSEPIWHPQLPEFRHKLSCAALSAADARAGAVAVACRSDAACQRVAQWFPRSDDFCVHVQHFGGTTTVAGQPRRQLLSLVKQCPYGGVVVLHDALTSGLANVRALLYMLSDLGSRRLDGASVRLHTFVFVLVEQVGAEVWDGVGPADDHQAQQQLRHAMRARLLAHYGTRLDSGSDEEIAVRAVERRVDVMLAVN